MAHVKRKCKTRIEIVGAGSPRPQSVRVGGPNPYEDSVAVARFLNMNQKISENWSRLADAFYAHVSLNDLNPKFRCRPVQEITDLRQFFLLGPFDNQRILWIKRVHSADIGFEIQHSLSGC